MPTEPTRSIPFNPVYSALQPFPVAVYADSAAVTLSSGIVQITKAGVAALTLAAPTEDGRVLVFDSTTAQAHTLTITAGLRGVGAGGDVLTWGGAIGDGITLYSYNGAWYVWPGTALNVTAG
jgi:hypothetical protein